MYLPSLGILSHIARRSFGICDLGRLLAARDGQECLYEGECAGCLTSDVSANRRFEIDDELAVYTNCRDGGAALIERSPIGRRSRKAAVFVAPSPEREHDRVIGLISDTHGLVRPEAMAALQGSELIIHAGDIGSPEVLETLNLVAPVLAVRGNNDRGGWAKKIPTARIVEIGRVIVYVLHDEHALDRDPAAAGFQVVVSGHSHHPSVEERNGVLFVNPGSAGPRRFSLPVCVGRLYCRGQAVEAKLIELEVLAQMAESSGRVKFRA